MPRFILDDEKAQQKRDLLAALGYDPEKVPNSANFVICEEPGSTPWLEVDVRGNADRFPISELNDHQREAFTALFDWWVAQDNELWWQP